MSAYSFEALDADGAARKGVLEADSARAARAQLRAQGLVPLAVQSVLAEAAHGAPAGALVRRRRGVAAWPSSLIDSITRTSAMPSAMQ